MVDSISKPLSPVPKPGDEKLACYKWLKSVYRIDQIVEKMLSLLMVVFTSLLVLLMFAQVIMRYIIKLPFLGIEELAPFWATWAYFLAIWYTSRIREHIGGGMLILVVKNDRIIKLVRLIGSVIVFLVTVIYTYYAYKMMTYNFEVNRLSAYLQWPRYLWSMPPVIGLFGSSVYLFIQILVEFADNFIYKFREEN